MIRSSTLFRQTGFTPSRGSRVSLDVVRSFQGGGGGIGGHGGGSGGGGGGGGGQGRGGGSDGDGEGSRRPRRWVMAGTLVGALQMTVLAGSASAAKKEAPAMPKELSVESVTNVLSELAVPILTNLGFSGVMGLVSGLALKKVGQFLAVGVGLLFIVLQGLAFTGAVTVNYSKMNEMIDAKFDVNGDGKLDQEDAKFLISKGLSSLAMGVPSVGGFLGGFVMGLKM